MTSSILTVEHEYCAHGVGHLLGAAGGVPVIDALDAATDRLEAVLHMLASLMPVGEVSNDATLAYYAAESALALVYAAHAGIEAASAPQNGNLPNCGAQPGGLHG